jgi:hypothetical protein
VKKLAVQIASVAAIVMVAAGISARARQQNPGAQVEIDEFRTKREPLGKMVKPSVNKLIGTWKFSATASRFENVFAPDDATRTYEDIGNGAYRYTQVVVTLDGDKSTTQYVNKDDGTPNEVTRLNPTTNKFEPTGTTVAFRWVDAFAAEQTENDHGVIAISRREISPDGKTITVTLPTHAFYYVSPHADDPVPDLIVFKKQ